MKTALSLDAISEQIEAAGFACSARVVREAKRIIEKLKQELQVAHTLIESLKYAMDKIASLSAENTTLTTANADLTTKLTAAQANARTPEEAAAEAQLVALVDSLDPAPVAPPAA